MKKLLVTILIIAFTFQSFALVKSLPIVITPVITPLLNRFCLFLIMKGAVVIAEEMAEPLDNYKVGVQHIVGSVDEEFRWPDGEYPTRTIERQRVYDYSPETNIEKWFFKTTWKTILSDGTTYITTDYSIIPPLVNDFNNKDVHYNRIALSGTSNYSYSHDSYEVVTAYCYRKGNKAWGLPVMAIIYGWEWKPLWRNDTLFHNPTVNYEDTHYVFLGPTGSGASIAIYKPRFVINTEIYDSGVATLYFVP